MRKQRWLLGRLFRQLRSLVADHNLDPFPIWRGLRNYRAADFRCDLRAGVNVALLAFPQGMAYALIAELPIQYGIVSGAVAAMVAPLFAGSRHTILGPTNATAFMLFSSLGMFALADKIHLLPVLVLMVGGLLVAGALLRVADLVQYVSRSVIVGYITGAAVLIIANQLGQLMGISLPGAGTGAAPKTFFSILQATFLQVGAVQWPAVLFGLGAFAVWALLSWRFRGLPVFAITLLSMTLAYAGANRWLGIELATFEPFRLHDLKPQLPRFTDGGIFLDMSRLFGIALSVAFLASMENSIMSKTLASRSGDRPNLNQDMLSLGLANLAAGFSGGMPASGSLTRSALNFGSGAVSGLSSIVSGALCGAGAVLLGRFMNFVPKTCLAALVICVAFSLINRRLIRIALFATPSDAAVLIVTFAAALVLPLSVAIFLGVGVSILLYLRIASRPYLTEYEFTEQGELREAGEKRPRPVPAISIVHVEGELFFGAAELFRTQIQKTCQDPALKVIILRLKNARHLDATSVMALEELIRFMRSSDRRVIVSGASREVYRVLRNAGMIDVIGRRNIFLQSSQNPNLSTRYALQRAQEILGTDRADVRIFYDPNQPQG